MFCLVCRSSVIHPVLNLCSNSELTVPFQSGVVVLEIVNMCSPLALPLQVGSAQSDGGFS